MEKQAGSYAMAVPDLQKLDEGNLVGLDAEIYGKSSSFTIFDLRN